MKKICFILAFCFAGFTGFSQTVAISPTGSGGFESGPSFGVNGWSVVNASVNQWAVGTGSVEIGSFGAYIGTPTTFMGTSLGGAPAYSHFYMNVAIPAAATNVKFSFRYYQPVTDNGFDSCYVSTTTATTTPIVNQPTGTGYTRLFQNTATVYSSYTAMGPYDLSALAGTTVRLVFTYRNDGADPIGIPAIDSISLTYCNVGITGTTSVCQGGTTLLSDVTGGGTWSSSNTSVATVGATGTVSGILNGTTTISYIQGTCIGTKVVTVSTPSPSVITGLSQVCAGSSITLSDGTSGGTWSMPAGIVASVGATTGSVTGMSAGTAVVSYTQGGCRVMTIVTVNPLPSVYDVTGGGTFCTGGNADVGLDWSDAGVDYSLYNGSGFVTDLTGITGALDFGTFSSVGIYTVSATDLSTLCTGAMSGSATLAVTAPVTPSVSIAPGTLTICSGLPLTLTATPVNGGTAPSYQWAVNTSPVGLDADNYTYTPTDGDVVSVTLTPVGICALPATAIGTYTIAMSPSLTPGVSIVANPGNPSCLGKPVTLSAVGANGGTAPTYLWNKNTVNVATGPSFIYTPVSGDVIICTITSNYPCRSVDDVASSPMVMTVEAGMAAPGLNITTHIAAGQPDTLVAVKLGGTTPVSYAWYVNGVAVAAATSSVFVSTTLANGDIVTCKVSNTDACANSTLKSVTIGAGGLGVSNTNNAGNNVSMFPNPNNGSFFIRGSFANGGDEVTLVVTNTLGQVVYNALVTAGNGELNTEITLGNAAPGMYLLSLRSGADNISLHFVVGAY